MNVNYCTSVAWEHNVLNKNKLHHIVYGPTRANYGLGAQLACCARGKAAEAVRHARQDKRAVCSVFRDAGSIRYDARAYRLLSMDRVSLNTLTGRIVGQLVVGDFQRRTLYDTTWKIGGAELIRRANVWYLHIIQTKADPMPDEPIGVIGVDLGIVSLAADSDGEQYKGTRARRFDRYSGANSGSTFGAQAARELGLPPIAIVSRLQGTALGCFRGSGRSKEHLPHLFCLWAL